MLSEVVDVALVLALPGLVDLLEANYSNHYSSKRINNGFFYFLLAILTFESDDLPDSPLEVAGDYIVLE